MLQHQHIKFGTYKLNQGSIMALIIGIDLKYWLSGIQKVGFQHTPKMWQSHNAIYWLDIYIFVGFPIINFICNSNMYASLNSCIYVYIKI